MLDTRIADLEAYRDAIRKFVVRNCTPDQISKWESDDFLPKEMLQGMAELGLLGVTVPEEYGGMGLDVTAMAVVLEELSYHWYGLGTIFNMAANYAGLNIVFKGSEEQKQRFLPKIVAGECTFSLGLSEPDVGADLASVKTIGERCDGKVIVNGTKRWISGGGITDYILTLVRSRPNTNKRDHLSFVIVPTETPGVTITRTPCMGGNVVSTADIVFEDAVLGEDMILGGLDGWNAGWSMLAGPSLEIEKLAPTIIAVATARAALDEAWAYSQDRVQGGKRICAHQSVRHILAEAKTKLLACELMTAHAVGKVSRNEPSAVDTSMAKLFVTETAKEIVLNCQQYVMGAYGYAQGFQMERLVREVLAFPIYGGSSAIQKNNIANLLSLPKS